jgi:hypothetical protein
VEDPNDFKSPPIMLMHSFYVPDDFLVRLIGAVHPFGKPGSICPIGSGSRVLPMIEFGYHIDHMTTRHVSIVRVSVLEDNGGDNGCTMGILGLLNWQGPSP